MAKAIEKLLCPACKHDRFGIISTDEDRKTQIL